MWTLVILAIIIYCNAVLSVKIIGHNDDWNKDYHDVDFIYEYFGSVEKAFFTFFQILTTDGWSSEILRNIVDVDRDPPWKIAYVRLFIIFFVVFATFTVLNLILAILVEKTFSNTRADEDQ